MAIPPHDQLAERYWEQEPPRGGDQRDPYQTDRSRIIHSAAFRRLQGKTQVMGVGEGDFHRTRLTHSIEAAQIGEGICLHLQKAPGLPRGVKPWLPTRDLVSAACLAHDLGHPPFGHGGERSLFRCMRHAGGFEGNAQTLRILTRLEKHRALGQGLNPTRRLILAILKYPVSFSSCTSDPSSVSPPKCYYDSEDAIIQWACGVFSDADRKRFSQVDPATGKPAHKTLDATIMETADDIAYGVHDLEDIVARALVSERDVIPLLKSAHSRVESKLVAGTRQFD